MGAGRALSSCPAVRGSVCVGAGRHLSTLHAMGDLRGACLTPLTPLTHTAAEGEEGRGMGHAGDRERPVQQVGEG